MDSKDAAKIVNAIDANTRMLEKLVKAVEKGNKPPLPPHRGPFDLQDTHSDTPK